MEELILFIIILFSTINQELERKSNAKLNTLLEIETAVQKKWEDERIFEVEAPEVRLELVSIKWKA